MWFPLNEPTDANSCCSWVKPMHVPHHLIARQNSATDGYVRDGYIPFRTVRLDRRAREAMLFYTEYGRRERPQRSPARCLISANRPPSGIASDRLHIFRGLL